MRWNGQFVGNGKHKTVRTIATATRSEEVQSLGPVRRTQAHAGLKHPSPSSDSPSASSPVQDDLIDRLGRTVKAALVAVHGSGQAAAITIAMDQSQMNRQLRIGTFDLRTSAAAGETFLAKLGEFLKEEFGTAHKTKKQLALERLPELLALMLAAVEDDE